MEIIYSFAMAAVLLIVLCVVVEAVTAVSRKPHWATARTPALSVVVTEDRRQQSLPFVGQDRRQSAQAAEAQDQVQPLRKVG